MSSETKDLSTLAEAIADGKTVDWKRAARDHAELDGNLRGLQTLQSIHDFHRVRTLEAPRPAAGGAEASAAEEALPQHWGKLEILGLLGRGACADVVKAFDPTLQREVALKLPRKRGEQHAQTFLNEVRRLARVRHENVLEIHGAEKHDGRVGMWSELLDGTDLEQRLAEQGTFSASETALIGIDLCRALAAIHCAGMVHRDIKAANVMREAGGRIVLMDFSSVVENGGEGGAESLSASTYGSPFYMAPELFAGNEATVQSDLYALGVLLYRLVSGRYPVEGGSWSELAEAFQAKQAVPLLDVRPELSASFVQVIERALALRPEQRYATAGEMERALSTAVASAPALESARSKTPPRWRRASWGVAALALVVALALAIGPRFLPAGPLAVEVSLFRRGVDTDDRLAPGTALALGEQLFLEVEGSRPFHAYVLNEDAAGEQWVLFPLPSLDSRNPLPGGVRHRLPGAAGASGGEQAQVERYWQVTSMGGEETLLLIASAEPLRDLEAALEGVPRASEAVPIDVGNLDSNLRGIGGLGSSPRDARPADVASLSSLSQRLLAGRSKDIKVWEIRLQNPSRGGSGPP